MTGLVGSLSSRIHRYGHSSSLRYLPSLPIVPCIGLYCQTPIGFIRVRMGGLKKKQKQYKYQYTLRMSLNITAHDQYK